MDEQTDDVEIEDGWIDRYRQTERYRQIDRYR